MFALLLVVGLVVCQGEGAYGQDGGPQTPRDRREPVRMGTSRVQGRVVVVETGSPLRRARVVIASTDSSDSRTASTDASGRYLIDALPKGRYRITVSKAGYASLQFGERAPGAGGRVLDIADGQTITSVDVALPRMGSISGRIRDDGGDGLSGATVLALQRRYFQGARRWVPTGQTARTDETGGYRLAGLVAGEYSVMAFTRELWPAEAPSTLQTGFSPTFWLAASSPAEAQSITVGFGTEVTNIDIALLPARAAAVTGRALNLAGEPWVGATVSLNFDLNGPGFSAAFGLGSTKVGPDGSFEFRSVLPGEFILRVKSPDANGNSANEVSLPVVVTGTDVDGVVVAESRPPRISGRVVPEEGAALPFPLTRLRVSSYATSGALARDDARGVLTDGSFEIAGVIGAQRLRVSGLPGGWAVKRFEYAGREQTSEPIVLSSGGRLDDVLVLVSNRFARVEGTVSGTGEASTTVIMFPQDSTEWENLQSIRTTNTDELGAFTIGTVPPGSYFAAAVRNVQDGDWFDPEFLKQLSARAVRLTVDRQSAQRVTLSWKE